MEILPIGIYGPYPPNGGATSCYVVSGGGAKLALDFGCGALSAIQKYLNPAELDGVVLSHLHYDHCCDILPLTYMRQKPLIVYTPANPTGIFSLIKMRANLDVRVIGTAAVSHIGSLSLRFCPVKHSVESYAVEVSDENITLVYTGDADETGALTEFCRGAKLVLCNCCANPAAGHMTLHDAARLRDTCKTAVLAAHVDPRYDCTEVAAKLKVPFAVAGESIEI